MPLWKGKKFYKVEWVIVISATPAYSNKEKGLTLHEIIGICSEKQSIEKSKICTTVPTPNSNSVFVVDMTAVGETDLTFDDSGKYDSHSSPSSLVQVVMTSDGKKIKNLKVMSRSKISEDDPRLEQDDTFLVRRLYSVQNNECGKCLRIISKVYYKSKLCKYGLIQYIGDRQSILRPHGNSRKRATLYMRTKPSVIAKEKNLSREMPPKKVINLIDKQSPQNRTSPSDLPRDRQQVYNLKKKSNVAFKARNTGRVAAPDFSKLVASMDNDGFVKNIDFASRERCKRIHPNTFAATHNTLTWTKTFCNPDAQHKSQLGIDMTYKVGPFFTTCLSFPHPMFVHKGDQQKHPTVFTGMSTSTGRQKEDYMYLAGQLKANGIEKMIYGTDGELALELGMEAIYPIEGVKQSNQSIKLRCFNHVKDDLDVELKKYPTLEKESVIKSLLGKEFNGKRVPGLVDSNNFEEDYRHLSAQWPTNFKKYIESKELKVRSLKETFRKCMGREIRITAGLGNPPNKYDNQRAESINSTLKESLGSHFVDQASVHDLVYENVVVPQEKELVKAIYGHGEYRLAPAFKHLAIHPLKWAGMTEQQKQHHINRVFHCKMNISEEKPILRKLSIQPEDCPSLHTTLPQTLIRDLWKAAELIISYNKVDEMYNGNFCVADDEKAYIIKETETGFSCQCSQFRRLGLCGHVIVVADDRGRLEDILKNFKYNPSMAIYKNKPISSGEKRVKKTQKRPTEY